MFPNIAMRAARHINQIDVCCSPEFPFVDCSFIDVSKLNIVILAAGLGKRMNSALPKVLHPLAGKTLLAHVLDAARALSPRGICVVYGHGGEAVPQAIDDKSLTWAQQVPQLGTGHAVKQVLPHLDEQGMTLILYGDVPLTGVETLKRLISTAGKKTIGLLTVELADPSGYGRIVRDGETGEVVAIVEEKDATAVQRQIHEINTGIMVIPNRYLHGWLHKLENNNAQKEYYLTDIIAMAVKDGVRIQVAQPAHAWETVGVNSKTQLAALERIYQNQFAAKLLEQGVTLADPARIDIRGQLVCGRDVEIDINCIFEGDVHLDAHDVHVGNFVEVKNSAIAAGSKANHLSYIGDAVIGKNVNIGAGTITCNYDGANKYQTIIEDDVFVGSDTQLIAPVTVAQGSTIGAGSTITKNTPPHKLTLSRARQLSIEGWQRPVKKPKGEK